MPLFLFRPSALLLLLICGLTSSAHSAANPVVAGDARFTVITPNCIRLEYANGGTFLDAPSQFAANRDTHYNKFRLDQNAKKTVIDTGAIRLIYTPDGKPFSASNLQALVTKDKGTAVWTPEAANPGNLGGTARALDNVTGAIDLGQGVLSRDGWYLLDDSNSPLTTADWTQIRPQGIETDWYLFGYGDDYRAALKSLAAIGGRVPMPRKYALGVWYSRFWPYSSDDFRQIVSGYDQHDFPLDNIVMDMNWHKDGWSGWSWNRKLLPDAEQLLPSLHKQGIHVTVNLHPDDGVGPQEDQYAAFMQAMGADPATQKAISFDSGSKKYMNALFSTVFAPLEKDGVDFWWLDWATSPDYTSPSKLSSLFRMNTLLYDRTAQNGQRGLSFSRWGGWGDHRHPINFSGDAYTTFPVLAFEVPFTATAGNVGAFFWSNDIGGFQGGRNEESYTRWVQFGATSPALRSHSTLDPNMDRRPWTYPTWAENSMRISFHLRDELFPYIYSSAWQASSETVPLNRPLYIDYQRSEQAYHNAQEYLYGDSILAAPIVTPGIGPGRVSHQAVWFPPNSDWYNYFTGERYSGGTDTLVSADIAEFPLYVKGGIPIPMQNYTPCMTTAPLNTLRVRCYPGADGHKGTSTLYEDDGQTQAYEHGAYATTPLSYLRQGNMATITVGPAKGKYNGQVTQRGIVVELPNTRQATNATVDGETAAISYDSAKMTNRILIPARSISQKTAVVIEAVPVDTGRLAAAAFVRRASGILGSFDFNGNATRKNLLTAALSKTTDPAQRDELLAAAGIGISHHSMAPYLYGGEAQDQFFAPAGLIDNDKVTLMSGASKRLTPNAPIDATGPKLTRRGRTVTTPGQVTFSIESQKIQQPGIPAPDAELLTAANLTATAKITANGSEDGYAPEGAVDALVGGYPEHKNEEWSAGSKTGAWLKLSWDTPQTVSRIVLFDRPNRTDEVTSGTITFSDGSTLDVGSLPDDGLKPLELRFPSKTITSLTFTVTGVKQGTSNAGLAEIGVF